MLLLTFALLCQIMSVAGGYTYAPVPKPLEGSPTLACIGISYDTPTNDFVTADQCKKSALGVSKFYITNSRGLLKLQPEGFHMNYSGSVNDFGKAELIAKKKFVADKYLIPTLHRKCCNHASNDIAHVIQLTGWVLNHEVGHLLGLQHTGSFSVSASGVVTYHEYGDNDSVMGATGSDYLTAPQYYQKGWLHQNEAALYEKGIVYELKQITNLAAPGLAVVLIPNQFLNKTVSSSGMVGKRNAYVAFPKRCGTGHCFAVYVAGSGASALIGSSTDEMYDEHLTGLHVKMVNVTKDTIKVTIDFLPPEHTNLRKLQPQESYDQAEIITGLVELNEDDTSENVCLDDTCKDNPEEN